MGLFDDAGIDIEELDTGIKDGKHPATLASVGVEDIRTGNKDNPDETAPQLVFAYDLDDSEFQVKKMFRILAPGQTFADLDNEDDSYNVYTFGTKEVRQTEYAVFKSAYGQLKRWMLAHGVDEKSLNGVAPEDLVGTEGVIVTKQNSRGYANAVSFAVRGASGTSLPKKPAATEAKSAPTATATASEGTKKPNPFARS